MKISKKGIDLIKKYEGCKLNAYLCNAGIPTIGYGATYYINGNKVKLGDNITQQQATELLDFHLDEFENYINIYLASTIVNQNIFDSLVSLCFNIGPGTFKKSGLLNKILKNKEINEAEFIKYSYAGGKIVNGLVNRRKEEYKLFVSK